jgi:UDP-glucose:(heptosyl)LPS alpha-1,3-glucosyltransferase
MLRIANALAVMGHAVDIYCMSWEGDLPTNNIACKLISAQGFMNHKRYASFIRNAQEQIKQADYDLVVGFNRMPDLDVYFAADPCYAERAHKQRGFFYKLSSRYRWFAACERAVFSPEVACDILLLAQKEKADFQRWYKTQDHRFSLLPPYLSAERMLLNDREVMRSQLRQSFGFAQDDIVMLLVGSGFRTKGLDRAIEALAALPKEVKAKTKLLAVGQDNPKQYQRLATELKVADRVVISPGRSDIPHLMQGADLLIHPARNELAGHVLIEAMASGLPVLTTDVCGYAFHVQQAQAGLVLTSPFDQGALNQSLLQMISMLGHSDWRKQGIEYAQQIMAANQGDAEAEILINKARNKRTEHDAAS